MEVEEHVIREEEKVALQYGDAFDHPNDDGATYRYLSKWFLVCKTRPKPQALPDSMVFSPNHVLQGVLVSNGHGEETRRVPIALSGLERWAVDRTPDNRGIWVVSKSNVWYRLLDPHPSQEGPHLKMRAWFGLTCNILDAFEGPADSPNRYAINNGAQTPKELYKSLCCTSDAIYEKYNSGEAMIFKEPWDMELVMTGGGLAYLCKHLKGMWPDSRFEKGLFKLQAKKKHWTMAMYKKSALSAEERSQCQPWGEPLHMARPTHPNWMAEIEIDVGANAVLTSKGSSTHEAPTIRDDKPRSPVKKKKTKKRRALASDSDCEEEKDKKPRKKIKKRHTKKSRRNDVQDSDDDDDDDDGHDDESPSSRATVCAENGAREEDTAEYSAKRMLKALKELKGFLTPASTLTDSGDWESVKDKFEVQAKKAQNLLESLSAQDMSGECKLLLLAAICKSCKQHNKHVFKKIFQNKIGNTVTPVKVMENWQHEATMQLKSNGSKTTCAYHFVLTHLRFVKDCSDCFPTDARRQKLQILRDKYALMWIEKDYCKEILSFGYKHEGVEDLRTACLATKKYLDDIRKREEKPTKEEIKTQKKHSEEARRKDKEMEIKKKEANKLEEQKLLATKKRKKALLSKMAAFKPPDASSAMPVSKPPAVSQQPSGPPKCTMANEQDTTALVEVAKSSNANGETTGVVNAVTGGRWLLASGPSDPSEMMAPMKNCWPFGMSRQYLSVRFQARCDNKGEGSEMCARRGIDKEEGHISTGVKSSGGHSSHDYDKPLKDEHWRSGNR